MKSIKWGIIGCGNVTEVKSGPAFNLVPDSSLVAVMRRDGGKAKDYAARHQVPNWYDDATRLINDPAVNAVYIATPPSSHEAYALAAIQAGKPVYLEKPMSLDQASSARIVRAASAANVKLSVAHYRRALPLFLKVKELLETGEVGEVRCVNAVLMQTAKPPAADSGAADWRIDPAVSGGGLFHDLSPHQLDLMCYYFGKIRNARGYAANRGRLNAADDTVSGEIIFENGVIFQGLWCFSASKDAVRDRCEIIGSTGTINFSFFVNDLRTVKNGAEQVFDFEYPRHVQQPFIRQVVDFFLDRGPNPCSGEEALDVMKVIDAFTAHSHDEPFSGVK